jgi:hypothetical protein
MDYDSNTVCDTIVLIFSSNVFILRPYFLPFYVRWDVSLSLAVAAVVKQNSVCSAQLVVLAAVMR